MKFQYLPGLHVHPSHIIPKLQSDNLWQLHSVIKETSLDYEQITATKYEHKLIKIRIS